MFANRDGYLEDRLGLPWRNKQTLRKWENYDQQSMWDFHLWFSRKYILYIYTYMYMYICKYTCTLTCIYIYIHIQNIDHLHIHTYTFAFPPTHTTVAQWWRPCGRFGSAKRPHGTRQSLQVRWGHPPVGSLLVYYQYVGYICTYTHIYIYMHYMNWYELIR